MNTAQVLVPMMVRPGTTCKLLTIYIVCMLILIKAVRYALEELGSPKSYEWDSMSHTSGQKIVWADLLDQKHNSDTPITQERFEVGLAGYNNVADWPAALFYEELVKAYPEAKVF